MAKLTDCFLHIKNNKSFSGFLIRSCLKCVADLLWRTNLEDDLNPKKRIWYREDTWCVSNLRATSNGSNATLEPNRTLEREQRFPTNHQKRRSPQTGKSDADETNTILIITPESSRPTSESPRSCASVRAVLPL